MQIRILMLALTLAGLVLAIFLLEFPSQVDAQKPASNLPPLHAGVDSPGAIPEEQPENPLFFFEGKVDWPLLDLSEPRTAWEYTQRGMFLQDDVGDVDGALQDYQRAEEMLEEIAARLNDPTLPERLLILHFRLGNIYLERGKYEDAIQEFEVLLEEDPELEGVHRHIAEAYIGLGEFEKAFEAFQEELSISPRSQKTNFEFALLVLRPDVQLQGVDQEALAREHLEIYLEEAARHCDTYPHKILRADKLVRELGGEGGTAALQNCFPSESTVSGF